MYTDLPIPLQQVVKEYLLADDFKTAKKIHDRWIADRHANENPAQYID